MTRRRTFVTKLGAVLSESTCGILFPSRAGHMIPQVDSITLFTSG